MEDNSIAMNNSVDVIKRKRDREKGKWSNSSELMERADPIRPIET